MCQPMPTGLYLRYEFDADLQRLKPRQNQSRSFKKMVMSYFQRLRPDCRIESRNTTGTLKKIACFNADGFWAHYNTVFETMGCFHHYCPCQEARPALTEEDIQRGTKKREPDEMRKQYIDEKGYTVVEMWECDWWKLYKTDVSVKEHLRESFPYKRPLRQDQLLDKIKSCALFGYVQCGIKLPEHLREIFANFWPILKNTNVCRQDFGPLTQEYAEKKKLMSQPQQILISSLELINGTMITHLLQFFLELGLVCTKIYHSVKCFNDFVQSLVNARRQ